MSKKSKIKRRATSDAATDGGAPLPLQQARPLANKIDRDRDHARGEHNAGASFQLERNFLEYDLRDSADEQRLRAMAEDDPERKSARQSASDRLEELADGVNELPTALLADYAKALEFERKLDGPDIIHCSMTMEIGFALDPQSIEDVCQIYIRASNACAPI